jgi:hypothetical protein
MMAAVPGPLMPLVSTMPRVKELKHDSRGDHKISTIVVPFDDTKLTLIDDKKMKNDARPALSIPVSLSVVELVEYCWENANVGKCFPSHLKQCDASIYTEMCIKIPSGNQALRDALNSPVVVVDNRMKFLDLISYLFPMVTQDFEPQKVQLKLHIRHKEKKTRF